MTLPGTASGSSSQTVPFNWESPEIKGDTLATGSESTADVYTREKRNVVVKVWKAVADGMDEVCTRGRMVREDLNYPDWDGLPVRQTDSPLKPTARALEFEMPLTDVEGVVVTPKENPWSWKRTQTETSRRRWNL